jgi:hypothetical protein
MERGGRRERGGSGDMDEVSHSVSIFHTAGSLMTSNPSVGAHLKKQVSQTSLATHGGRHLQSWH